MSQTERQRLRAIEGATAQLISDNGGLIPEGSFADLSEILPGYADWLRSGHAAPFELNLRRLNPNQLADVRTAVAQRNGALAYYGAQGMRRSITDERLGPFGGVAKYEAPTQKTPESITPLLSVAPVRHLSAPATLGQALGTALYSGAVKAAMDLSDRYPMDTRRTFAQLSDFRNLRTGFDGTGTFPRNSSLPIDELASSAFGTFEHAGRTGGTFCGLVAGGVADLTPGESPRVRAKITRNSLPLVRWLMGLTDGASLNAGHGLAWGRNRTSSKAPPLGTAWLREYLELKGTGDARRLVIVDEIRDHLSQRDDHLPLREANDKILAGIEKGVVTHAGCPAGIALPNGIEGDGAKSDDEPDYPLKSAAGVILLARVSQVSEHSRIFDIAGAETADAGTWVVPHGREALEQIEALVAEMTPVRPAASRAVSLAMDL